MHKLLSKALRWRMAGAVMEHRMDTYNVNKESGFHNEEYENQ